jgi:nitrogen regulatory protein PII
MNALFLILNQTDKLDEILETLYDLGVGSTTVDSVGMGKVLLNHNIHPTIFTSLRNILNEDKAYNKTIISVIKDEDILNEAVEKISNILDIDNAPGVGFLFVMPVVTARGGYHEN